MLQSKKSFYAKPSTILAIEYGKKFGTFVPTGTAGLELALELCEVGFGDFILVPADCCFLVPASILRKGAIPVFVDCGDSIVPPPGNFAKGLSPRVKAIIAVHHLGLPCDIKAIKNSTKHAVPIIEDASLGFGLQSQGSNIGSYSDITVASFGLGKPLSFGQGGGVFSNDLRLLQIFDRHGARNASKPPASFPMPNLEQYNVETVLSQASLQLNKRRNKVMEIRSHFRCGKIIFFQEKTNDNPTWHRLPLWINPALKKKILRTPNIENFVQFCHEEALINLPMFKGKHSKVGKGLPCFPSPLLLRLERSAKEICNWLEYIIKN